MTASHPSTNDRIPKVVHCKRDTYDVYIGRPSKWGNPFSHKPGSVAPFSAPTREDSILKYRMWLMTQPQLVADAKAELRGKTLGCWCAPRACHGDVLLEIANG